MYTDCTNFYMSPLSVQSCNMVKKPSNKHTYSLISSLLLLNFCYKIDLENRMGRSRVSSSAQSKVKLKKGHRITLNAHVSFHGVLKNKATKKMFKKFMLYMKIVRKLTSKSWWFKPGKKNCFCIKQIFEVWRRPNLQQLRNWFIPNMLLSGYASLCEKISYEDSYF